MTTQERIIKSHLILIATENTDLANKLGLVYKTKFNIENEGNQNSIIQKEAKNHE